MAFSVANRKNEGLRSRFVGVGSFLGVGGRGGMGGDAATRTALGPIGVEQILQNEWLGKRFVELMQDVAKVFDGLGEFIGEVGIFQE